MSNDVQRKAILDPSNLSLSQIVELEEKFHIGKQLSLEKAMRSGDIEQIYQAKKYLQGIEKRKSENSQYAKALLVDPLDMSHSMGYKEKYFTMSFDILRAMARTHIIKAIIETRKEQAKDFCKPVEDKYSTGFIIEKKGYGNYSPDRPNKKMSRQERKIADELFEFMLNCGTPENEWHADDFETYMGKYIEDSLTMDQATSEIVRNEIGDIVEFYAVDGATFRIADTYDENSYQDPENMKEAVKGYLPSYVQVWNSQVLNDFYPWEIMFGVRNPKTDIRRNGYGMAELEDLIQTVTAILNSDFYNANFFKVGSAPKGILRVHGEVSQSKIDEFKASWQTGVTGVLNMHKIPVLHAERADFVSLQQTNRDMEFAKYQDFLIKIACAIFKIDPEEIGFKMGMGSDGKQKPLFEGNNEGRLKYSRDKGLRPLLRWKEKLLNKYIVDKKHPGFKVTFVGINPIDQNEELDNDIKAVQNLETIDEVRQRRGQAPLKDGKGDIILNPVYMQAQQMAMMGNQQSNQFVQGDNGKDEGEDNGMDNPFMKGIEEDFNKIFTVEKIRVN